jgi:DNA-binding transcriptional MerR regulator
MKSSLQAVTPATAKPAADGVELTIGELADHFGLATHVLRHWESVGLLTPARRVNGRRRYTKEHLTLVAIILHGRGLGFGLEDLRTMLSAADGDGRREVLRRHRAELDHRIAKAMATRELIDHALECEVPDFLDCPNFQQLVHRLNPPECATPPGGGQ